ncbi:uncharacterized protein LOC106172600 isoform X2 [Lingula anatina]|uniref:Uncharacterized protein LOC106172600 isoform X2 n=1 Tax=Lingula anatina TaxID=7574 RepID=A0A1S3JEJ2_LINAN|nr:uncharacterized protein LOC106172600 isoform X2 [Lingula anatina]|eukprot:XP_013408835.1 uncharacterized protein LOC106172600 isoform X2 [Lingula anatina]
MCCALYQAQRTRESTPISPNLLILRQRIALRHIVPCIRRRLDGVSLSWPAKIFASPHEESSLGHLRRILHLFAVVGWSRSAIAFSHAFQVSFLLQVQEADCKLMGATCGTSTSLLKDIEDDGRHLWDFDYTP